RQQEEQLSTDTESLTTSAQSVKEQLESALTKPAPKDIVFKPADLKLAEKGTNVTRTMLNQLQRTIQKQLDTLVKQGRDEEGKTRKEADQRIADIRARADQDLGVVRQEIAPDVQKVRDEAKTKQDEVGQIKWMQIMTEGEYRAYADRYRF